MQTVTAHQVETVVTGEAPRTGIIVRSRKALAALFAFLSVTLLPSVAHAAPVDATGGAGGTFIDDLKTQFLSFVVPAALGLMVAVLGISVLVAWGRKAVKSR